MPDDLINIPNQNTGFLEGSGTKDLWLGGRIPHEVVLPSGDWRPFVPLAERQRSKYADTMACVTFSDMNVLEIQAKQQTGVEPNWSDRFIAKLSGTTHQGNYLDKVADTVRHFGVVKEEEWPVPKDYTWDSYYAEVPQDVIKKATKLDIAYESTVAGESELRHHLKHSPLQIVLTKTNPRHAVTLLHIDGTTAYYFDHYDPYLRSTKVSNIYKYALKIVLKGNMNQTKIVKGKDGKTLWKCVPIATDFENFKKQMSVEGVTIPEPVPNADSL